MNAFAHGSATLARVDRAPVPRFICARHQPQCPPITKVTYRQAAYLQSMKIAAHTTKGVLRCSVSGTWPDDDNGTLPDVVQLDSMDTYHDHETGGLRECSDGEVVSGGRGGGRGQGGSGAGGGSGHGSGGDSTGSSGAGGNASDGFLSRMWPGWKRRVMADPDFPFKVLMEETVGLGLAASGMIAARGKNILNELDFAFCDIAVGATLNLILVYLLSPVASAQNAASSTAGISKAISSLPANIFAPGTFTLPQRLSAFIYKGGLFAICGFVGSVVGTSISQGLIAIRESSTSSKIGKSVSAKPLPNVGLNSLAWAGFMFFSSNPRYQAVAGLERALFAKLPELAAKTCCACARTVNNVVGGAIWVWWARALGIQDTSNT